MGVNNAVKEDPLPMLRIDLPLAGGGEKMEAMKKLPRSISEEEINARQ